MTPQDLATVQGEAEELAAYHASLGDMPVDLGSRLAFARAVLHLSAALRAPLPEALAEIETRAEAATDPPWYMAEGGQLDIYATVHAESRLVARVGTWSLWPENDAIFIAHARADVPALLAAYRGAAATIRERDAEIARLRADLEEHRAYSRASKDG